MSIPLIIVHSGDSIYLKYTLKQARYYNPDTPIYLIGDQANNKYDFITHIDIEDYAASAEEFLKHYIHMSFTPLKFEQYCFARWFIAKDFVEKNKINRFLCLDSDVLLFCKTCEVNEHFSHYDFTTRGKAGAGFNYFSSIEALKKYCDFIYSYYTKPDLFHILELNWEGYQKMNYGGVCDMLFFDLYYTENEKKIGDVGKIENNSIFEYCLSDTFKNNEKLKFKNSILYILKKETQTWIQIKALHVNIDKDKIYRYYTGGGLYKERFKDWFRDMRDKYQLRTRIRKLFSR
jgi:hypothetical protein